MEDYWVDEMTKKGVNGEPLQCTFWNEDRPRKELPYPPETVQMFVNLTVVETRVHKHMYYVFESSDAEFFCTEDAPAGFKNVIPPGLCGRNGYIQSGSKVCDCQS